MIASSASENEGARDPARGSHVGSTMPPALVRRVEILEEQVNTLSQLPERVAGVEAQLVAMRDELGAEIRAGDEETRREMHALRQEVLLRFERLEGELRAEIRAGDEETRREMHALHEAVLSRIERVEGELRAGDEETRRHMRVLHEDVVSRLALLQEGVDWRNGPSGRPPRTRTPPKRRR